MVETFTDVPRIRELIELMKNSKYTTTKLAHQLEMNRSELSQILNKKRGVSHEKFVKIYNFLYSQKKGSIQPLYKICSKKIASVKPTDSLKKVKEIMAEKKFDAIPVYDKGKVVGKVNSFYVGTRIYPQDTKTKVKEKIIKGVKIT